MAEMTSGALVIDDISHYETERLIEIYRPDVFCAGIKEKYAVQKMGVPMQATAQLRLRRPVRRFPRGRSTSTARSTGWSTARSGSI